MDGDKGAASPLVLLPEAAPPPTPTAPPTRAVRRRLNVALGVGAEEVAALGRNCLVSLPPLTSTPRSSPAAPFSRRW